MTAALDTNVLLDVLLPNPAFVDASRHALEEAAQRGPLVICELVYAELCGQFTSKEGCDLFLDDNQINVSGVNDHSCFLASRFWLRYLKHGGSRIRILPDFLIGAHAQLQASCLISRDSGFFRKQFPNLKIIVPSAQ